MSGVVIAETVRRHLTSIAWWSFVALLTILAFGTARFNSPAAMWPTLVALLAVITGAGVIGPEFSSGTLQLILVKPVTRSAYLLSRAVGVTLTVWMAAAVVAVAELAGRAILTDGVPFARIGAALLNSAADTVLVVALLAFFGSFTRAYFNVALYVVLQIGLGIAAGVLSMSRKYPAAVRVVEEISRNLFPDAPLSADVKWLLLVLSNASVALVLACLFFRRREVPYGAD